MLQVLPKFPAYFITHNASLILNYRCSYLDSHKSWISKYPLKELISQECQRIWEAQGNLLLKYF